MTERAPEFDERAALETFERLHREILAARRRRTEKIEEFDAFLRASREFARRPPVQQPEEPFSTARGPESGSSPAPSMSRGDQDPPFVEASAVHSSPFEPGHRARGTGVEPPQPIFGRERPPAAEVVSVEPVPDVSPISHDGPTPPPPREIVFEDEPVRAGIPARWRAAVAIVAVALLAVLVVAYRRAGAPAPPAQPVADSRQAPAAPETASPGPTTPEAVPAPAPAGHSLEILTTRPVWLRVTVDNDVVLQREIPANERLRFEYAGAISVRAGDSGAVRLVVGGRDEGVMGPPGIPRTRIITAPPAGS